MAAVAPIDRVLAALEAATGFPARRAGDAWSARCPAHEDRSPSLSVRQGDDDKVVLHCFAGCSVNDVLAAARLEMTDLFPPRPERPSPNGKPVYYDYTDEKGDVLFRVVRGPDKKFWQQRRVGDSWVNGLAPGTRRPLYRLPEVLKAVNDGQTIFVVEGEKDVEAVRAAGGVATCNPMGAGKWQRGHADSLRGASRVVVVADKDEPGRAHARTVAESLSGRVDQVVIAEAKVGKDAADHLGAGLRLEDLEVTAGESEAPARRLIVQDGNEVRRRKVSYLWKPWLPRRKLVMVDGDPEVGKSTLCLDLAARITRGREMPDGSAGAGPAHVVLLCGEDDADDTIAPRLDAAGADDRFIHFVHATEDPSGECPVTIPQDVDLLEEAVGRYGAVLVVVDVLSEYLDGRVDTNSQGVRRPLAALRTMARRTDSAVLCLRHLRKEATDKAIYAGGGSIGIIAAARAGWLVGFHPEDSSVRVLAAGKMNLANGKPPSLMFSTRPWPEDPDIGYVEWGAAVDLTANQLVQPAAPVPTGEQQEENEEKRRLVDRVKEAIETFLPVGRDNAILSNELREQVLAATRCSPRTYDSAHTRVTFGQAWRVDLPDGTRGMKVWRPEPPPAVETQDRRP